MIFNVADYDPFADGVHCDNAAFQAAVDACNEAGGGTVLVPAYTYLVTGVVLKSGVHLHFEDGAVLLGSPDFADYPADEVLPEPNPYQDVSHTFYKKSMFYAADAEHIAVTGHATIDMRNPWDPVDTRESTHRGPKTFAFMRCRDLLLADMRIRRSVDICVMLGGCDDVTVRGLDLYVYIDGISPDSCHNVLITDCHIVAGDDGIVLKTSNVLGKRRSCENIKVCNCYVSSRCSALKFGTETYGDIRNVSFSDCTVENTRIAGIAIESVDGATVENIEFRNITMKNVGSPLFMKIGSRMRAPVKFPGGMKHITIENVTATGPYITYPMVEVNYYYFMNKMRTENPDSVTSSIIGRSDMPIEDVTLRNLYWEVMGGHQTPVARKDFDLREANYPEVWMYGKDLPAYGLILKNAEGVKMENVKIVPLAEDNRPCFLDESNQKG